MPKYRVISEFLHRASGRYVAPGGECPEIDAETAERLVRAGCLEAVNPAAEKAAAAKTAAEKAAAAKTAAKKSGKSAATAPETPAAPTDTAPAPTED